MEFTSSQWSGTRSCLAVSPQKDNAPSPELEAAGPGLHATLMGGAGLQQAANKSDYGALCVTLMHGGPTCAEPPSPVPTHPRFIQVHAGGVWVVWMGADERVVI